METIKLQKSQTWLLQEKKLRILEAQSVVQDMGNNFQEVLNQIVRENGIQDLTNWVLSEDMTEIRKKEKNEPKPTTVGKKKKKTEAV